MTTVRARVEQPEEAIGPKLDRVGLHSRHAREVRYAERVGRIVEGERPDLRIELCQSAIISTDPIMRTSHTGTHRFGHRG